MTNVQVQNKVRSVFDRELGTNSPRHGFVPTSLGVAKIESVHHVRLLRSVQRNSMSAGKKSEGLCTDYWNATICSSENNGCSYSSEILNF